MATNLEECIVVGFSYVILLIATTREPWAMIPAALVFLCALRVVGAV